MVGRRLSTPAPPVLQAEKDIEMPKPWILVTEPKRQPPQALEEFVRKQRESFIGTLESTAPAQV